MYVKQCLGSTIVFGCEDIESEVVKFEIFCHNYSVSDHPHKIFPTFSFIITNKLKLINGLTQYFKHDFYLNKKCGPGEFRILALQKALRTFREAREEQFYTMFLREVERNKRYIESILGSRTPSKDSVNYSNNINYPDNNETPITF